jgi:chemotaxis family two-component system response regulator Rcp1
MSGDDRIDILLVEDNPGDIRLITESLTEAEPRADVHCVRDGVEAMRFLLRQDPFRDAPEPTIIVLDLNLPRKDGRTVLAEIKSHPLLAVIPVVVLSGSDAPQDIIACYKLHANCYLVKPRDLYGMNEAIRSLVDFWLRRATLPPCSCSHLCRGENP